MSEVVDVLRFTALQGIAQRGHGESESSDNRGNFLELMELLAKRNPLVRKKLSDYRGKYTHHDIQNEILSIIAKLTREEISAEVAKASYYSVMIDESKDVSKSEQLSVVIRYYLKGTIYERFLGFRKADGLDANFLFLYMKETLSSCGVKKENCVSQTYDGANVLSGDLNGVQAKFRKEVPWAIYNHCWNHKLHLVLVDTCKRAKRADKFFSLLQQLYVFMSGSVAHTLFLEKQKLMNKGRVIELKALSETRWACQVAACHAVHNTLPAIVVTLGVIAKDWQNKRSQVAQGLLNSIDMEFIVHL